ncbi:hypothetical protein [Salipiger mucosus]|uniref:Uncharacterized protein n=1 Tax=Salipiger mucosus DSM 16094 TaxID=1123237 RepID=S9QLV9_9RHOB|nr:hypothetical protein [Salipiger mucosus]EPX82451.1 hypothetical protein Salmuc_05200 [Salipiger mucosus DSM 16094]
MKGWRIFLHSARMVIDNLGAALRVSMVLYLVQVASQLTFFVNAPMAGEQPTAVPEGLGLQLTLSIFALLASLWIAVAWHRYVLTGELPAGLLPRWHGSEIARYFGQSLLIGLVVILAALAAGVVIGLVATAVPGFGGVLIFGLLGLCSYLFFRLGLVLPAAALGRRMTIGESWAATRDDDGAVVTLAVLVIGVGLLVEVPALLDQDSGSLIALVYRVVLNWFVTMIGVSVLTTLYGHFVEHRPVD